MSADDLRFFANIQHDIGCNSEAINYMKKLIEVRPGFTKEDRNIFGLIFKDAIDAVRSSLKKLINAIMYEESQKRPEYADRIEIYKAKSFSQLEELCTDALGLIENTLLPNAIDDSSRVFFYKMVGDLHRYLSEFMESYVTDTAMNAYTEAIKIAENSLSPRDPSRLGAILNYAVFLYRHLGDRQSATEVLTKALSEVEKDETQMSDGTLEQAFDIIRVMETNLMNWEREDDGLEEEEDYE